MSWFLRWRLPFIAYSIPRGWTLWQWNLAQHIEAHRTALKEEMNEAIYGHAEHLQAFREFTA